MFHTVERHSLEAFEKVIAQPENVDKRFEYIAGEICEVPSNPLASKIAGLILTFLNMYIFKNNGGQVTGSDGGYMIGGDRYAPDVAFISTERYPEELPYDIGYLPVPPDLAVEVVSPSDDPRQRSIKITNYLAAGTVVWVVYPMARELEVHAQGQRVRIYGRDDTLEGSDMLPGFAMAIKDIFPASQAADEA
ncbi:MAG: Uma2 family endonuclease [Anaerolineae bacterium]|nr:Uma2 family endonuclease [Anaerolineae bacterium]